MYQKLEGVHVELYRHMMGQEANRKRDGTWRSEAAAKLLKETGNKTLGAYIDKRQENTAEWV